MEGLTAVVLRRVAAALAGARYPTDTVVTVVVTEEEDPRVVLCQTPKEVRETVKGFGGADKVHVIKDCVVAGVKPSQEWRLTGIELTLARVRRKKEETRQVQVDINRFDALFWSGAAVEKFMVPHYSAVHGAAFAANMLTAYDTAPSDTLVHDCNSQYTSVSDPTTVAP